MGLGSGWQGEGKSMAQAASTSDVVAFPTEAAGLPTLAGSRLP